ncbi:MAG: 3-carboxy-cis,cis-muconate cycloisomerase [Herminiimonas sp.]|nr:3-carboxy-cis,cis-muconate cycloisomerase [Herminiimonas sp.]
MSPMSSRALTGPMFSTDEMRAVFSDGICVQRMLDFEAALARAQGGQGVIPDSAVDAIEHRCDVALIDLSALAEAAAAAGNLAIPLVKQLTEQVAGTDAEAAKFVHWGATSQDVIDTGTVLQLRAALDLIDADLALMTTALARLADIHRGTLMVGRTWMQHALPMTFGLKAAGWLDAILRHQDRLAQLRPRVLVLQFGGACGTLASLGDRGLDVAQAMAADLGLSLPDLPWHTQRDRVAEVATVMGMLVGTLGKIARDIALHMQTEVAELAEPVAAGRGGSSTMPHKRNPVACAVALAAAVRVPPLVSSMLSGMVQEHERALGGWQAEWDTLPDIMLLTSGALRQMCLVASGLLVDEKRMRCNLEATRGLVMAEAITLALGSKTGRLAAHHLVEQACRLAVATQRHLHDVLMDDAVIAAHLSPAELRELFDPAGYTGASDAFVERVLKSHRNRSPKSSDQE